MEQLAQVQMVQVAVVQALRQTVQMRQVLMVAQAVLVVVQAEAAIQVAQAAQEFFIFSIRMELL
jgi:hypothetical protein